MNSSEVRYPHSTPLFSKICKVNMYFKQSHIHVFQSVIKFPKCVISHLYSSELQTEFDNLIRGAVYPTLSKVMKIASTQSYWYLARVVIASIISHMYLVVMETAVSYRDLSE
jgi:hypothetical protein